MLQFLNRKPHTLSEALNFTGTQISQLHITQVAKSRCQGLGFRAQGLVRDSIGLGVYMVSGSGFLVSGVSKASRAASASASDTPAAQRLTFSAT